MSGAIAPICGRCGHGHFKSAPCPTGDVVDARYRFTIARAAAIAKRNPDLTMGQGFEQAWSAEELQAVIASCEHIEPPRDMDGRVVEP
jgi:hypothetical protein